MKKEFSALEWVFLFLLICMSNNRPSSIALISLLAHHSAPCIDHKPCNNIVMRINIPLRWIFQNVRITNLLLQMIEKPQTQGAVTRVITPSVAGIVSKMPQVHGCLPHAHLRTGATHALLVGLTESTLLQLTKTLHDRCASTGVQTVVSGTSTLKWETVAFILFIIFHYHQCTLCDIAALIS